MGLVYLPTFAIKRIYGTGIFIPTFTIKNQANAGFHIPFVPWESVMGKMTRPNLGVQALRTLIVWAFGLQLGATKRGGQRATSKRCLHDRP